MRRTLSTTKITVGYVDSTLTAVGDETLVLISKRCEAGKAEAIAMKNPAVLEMKNKGFTPVCKRVERVETAYEMDELTFIEHAKEVKE